VVLLLLSLSILMVVGVFFRYVLNNSIYWSGEVSCILLVFVSFFASTVAYKRGAHIGIDVFMRRLTENGRMYLHLAITVSFLGFWLLVLLESFKLMPMFMIQRTATLEIRYAYVFAVVPVSAAIWILHSLADIASTLQKKKKGTDK